MLITTVLTASSIARPRIHAGTVDAARLRRAFVCAIPYGKVALSNHHIANVLIFITGQKCESVWLWVVVLVAMIVMLITALIMIGCFVRNACAPAKQSEYDVIQ